jgi:polyadenylate-binding protein
MATATLNSQPTPATSTEGAPNNGSNVGANAAMAAGNPGAPSTLHASASLYVGDLAPDVTEALLFEIFNAVGPVASVRVCRDTATRRSLGYAYVNFLRVDDAERALDTMNFKGIRGRPCRIMWSHRDPFLRRSGLGNVFVKNLSQNIDNKTLFDTFSAFGNILSCKIVTNSKTRESLGYGFVHFENEDSAQRAIDRVDGMLIDGQKVSVALYKSKKERGGFDNNTYTNVFVKNLPENCTKEELEELFSKHGKITSCVISPDTTTKNRAFGFVNFATAEEASAAVTALNDTEYKERKLYVGRAQKKEEREAELQQRFEQVKLERQKQYAGVNLYVKNLSEEVDDARLTTEFSKFGSITSSKIMRDASGKSRGFGFVCFSTPEEATKAVTDMNGRMLENKPLYVSLAQRKEARRQQLEAQYAARAKLGALPGAAVIPAGAMGTYPAVGGPPMMFQQGGMPGQQRLIGYSQGQVGNRMMYPPHQVPMGVRAPVMNPGMNYQLMPMNGRNGPGMPMGPNGPNAMGVNMAGPGQVMQGNNRQGNRPNRNQHNQRSAPVSGPMAGKQMQMMPGMMPGMVMPQLNQGNQPNIRYTENARNRGNAQNANGGASTGASVPPMNGMADHIPSPSEPLTTKVLAAAPEAMRKQMIGERLFPLVSVQQPELASKITGMLLEMDNYELIHLLESQPALNEKIQEALQVLQMDPTSEEGAQ